MNKRILAFVLACAACNLLAADKADGIKAAIERRRMMPARPKPERQIVKDGAILSLFADGTVTTQAVRMVRMSASTKKAVDNQLAEDALLVAAKELAEAVKARHGKAVEGLSDAEIVAVSGEVTNTTSKESGAAVVIGVLLGAAVVKSAEKKKLKEENGNGKAR